MNIGITCYPTFGGSGVIATEVGIALAERGHRVHFIAYDTPGRLPECTNNIFFHEVEVREYPLFRHQPYALSLTSKIVEVSEFENLDILHVHYAVPHATSAYLARQILGDSSPKIVTTLHGTDITLVGRDRSYLPITRFSIMQSDIVTAPSIFLQAATYEKLDIEKTFPIQVIPNFVNTSEFAPPVDSQNNPAISLLGHCPRKAGTKLLVHVSNFRAVKRVEDLIRSFQLIRQEIDSHLVLIGDGPTRSNCENLARELGVSDSICFLGKQEKFLPWLQYAELFLLPSELESFGLAALEAMSCGVPIVATNAQGIPEVVEHGTNGLLSNVGDWKSMASNAIEILSNTKLQMEFSKKSRDIVLNKFTRDEQVDKYESIYAQLHNV